MQLPETVTKTILCSYAANFLQICVNFQKYWNCNAMSNDGLNLENMDPSQIHSAVQKYHRHAIITRDLYIFYHVFKEVLSENSFPMYV